MIKFKKLQKIFEWESRKSIKYYKRKEVTDKGLSKESWEIFNQEQKQNYGINFDG